MDYMIADFVLNLPIIINIAIAFNLATFFLFGYDKWQAIHKGRRVPEKTLFLMTLLGGSVGTLIGMNIFRHKTSKTSFQFVVAMIVLLHVILILTLASGTVSIGR